ncbi:membrane dipeptidase (plasmid) [Photobacterium sp. DA100]|uniref:membrane dipeptidase n=1 Tax=Photobacterium sp. DA100 TaxID=3027472 RepID=UPI002478DF10|nr:membrane dipeptidase [Photobacterium sp. DA100]WEM45171.1 membrane dipeptidase [Photobacterium sp. DA100]
MNEIYETKTRVPDTNAVCIDIAKYSTKPVIASHSNPDHFVNITRNISDEAIVAIAKTDGVVAINFLGGWHNKDGDASPEALAKSVNYIAEHISQETEKNGRLHTGFGSDYIHTYEETLNFTIRNPDKFNPENGYASITEMAFAIDAWGVAKVLEEQYGWEEKEIRGFLGENLLRVFKANWING